MLETHYVAPKTLQRLRSGPSGPYIDGFAQWLDVAGYSHACVVRYLRAAVHLGHFLELCHGTLGDIDSQTAATFLRHLSVCRCPYSKGGTNNHHPYFGINRYREYLVQIGVCQNRPAVESKAPEPALVAGFRQWLFKHRGAADSTVRLYSRDAIALICAIGDDPKGWDAKGIRGYFVDRTGRCGVGTAEKLVTSLRAFLRYLEVYGHCRADLHEAVPAYAGWHLADLPRYWTTEELDRVIAACEGDTPRCRRDRAIILLLARLGLRAGDVAKLRMTDIEWSNGTMLVTGKGRFQVRLPLPQDVGDAIIDYLQCRPQIHDSDRIFIRNIAPHRPFLRGDGISNVVRRAMGRAGVTSPAKGAHALRHTAATQMLRHGVPLDKIALVLRHRGIDTTAYYAKSDVTLLSQIAQPWPAVLS